VPQPAESPIDRSRPPSRFRLAHVTALLVAMALASKVLLPEDLGLAVGDALILFRRIVLGVALVTVVAERIRGRSR
jgi:hypothetical protein